MPTAKPILLIIDDDRRLLASLQRALRREYTVLTAADRAEALREVLKEPDIVLLDIRLNAADVRDQSGVGLLREMMGGGLDAPVVMFSAYGDVETVISCIRHGAADFVQKSASTEELQQRLSAAFERAHLSRQVIHLEERLQQLDPTQLVGESAAIEEVKRHIFMVASDSIVTVLVRGETGTGKELVARAVHRIGLRAREPFVPISIAALNPNLIESELFGHEPGAYTGARERRVGFIEKARRGVLFLDEIGELPVETQLKLLRFLEDRRFARVGSSEEQGADVQIVAATNRPLEEAVAQGRMREDLYFRLRGAEIFLPPLRERRADIPLLAAHFLNLFRAQGRTRLKGIREAAMQSLVSYAWPGNVRELKTVLERAIIYANHANRDLVEQVDLPPDALNVPARGGNKGGANTLEPEGVILDLELARTELSYIEEALRLTLENKSVAWKLLGLNDRFALLRRVKVLYARYPKLVNTFPTVRRLYGNISTLEESKSFDGGV